MYSDENNALKLGYDCVERSWPKWFDKLPIEMSSLPNIKIPGQSIGELRNSELIDLGFSNKTMVIAGTTDSIAAFLATGAKNTGEAVSSIFKAKFFSVSLYKRSLKYSSVGEKQPRIRRIAYAVACDCSDWRVQRRVPVR